MCRAWGGFPGVVYRVHVEQNTSDHSLFILALMARKTGEKTAHESKEKSLSGEIARDRLRAD
jgi:hypothetical protein